MAKIYGNITATPIKPDLFTTTVDQVPDITSENAISNKAMIQYVANEVLNTEQFAKDYTDSKIVHTYDPNSEKAMSGIAVAEAIDKNNAQMNEAIHNGDTYALNTANAYTDEKVGDIETALDRIIEIQEEMIFIKFEFGRALKGMTWGEWLDSPYYLEYLGDYNDYEPKIDALMINERNEVVNTIGDPVHYLEDNGADVIAHANDIILADKLYMIG